MNQLYTCTLLCSAKSLQSCLILCDPMDCILPDFSVHGILQARIPNGLSFLSARDLSNPGIDLHICPLFFFFFPDFLPICVTTEHWIDFPMLYIRFSLVIYFIHIVYMSIPTSQLITPLFPLPCFITVSFFSISMTIFLLKISSSV